MPLNLTDLIIESRTETPERYEFLVLRAKLMLASHRKE
jgi:hypothetical protein